MLCNVAGFASLCHAMKCHVPGFCHCGVVCVLATVTIAAGFFFCIAIICGFQYFRDLFSFHALHAMPSYVMELPCNCPHAIVVGGLPCVWYAQCYTCLFLGACMLSHALCTYLCVHSLGWAYCSQLSHTRDPNVFPWDVIVTEDSFSVRRPTARGTWLVGQPGVDINHLRPIYVQLVQNNSPPSPPRTPLPAF